MLLSPHPHLSYFTATDSVGRAAGTQWGTNVASGTANAYGSWVQIHAGLTYPSQFVQIALTACETSADVVAATTRNSYVDIGIGPDTSNVTVIMEKLCGSHANAIPGRVYYFPFRIPPDIPIFARHQNTQASAKIGVNLMVHGGNMNPGTIPEPNRLVCLGATTASTTGTAITPGASAAEGSWTQIVASTTDDYAGIMIGGLFTVDTTMTSGLTTVMDASIGGSGQELTIGENLTTQVVYSGNEEVISFSIPTMLGIPVGSRLCVRASGSAAADTTNSVVLYGFAH